jgi:hypothetical protein
MSEKKIRTTINFLSERLECVQEASVEAGLSYKDVIRLCINRFIENFDKSDFKEIALKYQPDSDNWTKVHFAMSPEEYDVYFDCKKVCRCSFSLIVAMAIDQYLESVLNGDQEYSYPIDGYTKFCHLVEKYPIYTFCWKKKREN